MSTRNSTTQVTLDPRVHAAFTDAVRHVPQRTMDAFRSRQTSFPSSLAMELCAVSMNPPAREWLDNRLSELWASQGNPSDSHNREFIIGSGIHAAIYAATRVQAGHARPIVLERASQPGGVFAMSKTPTFRLNSVNLGGSNGDPQDFSATTNFLPGAPIQPNMIRAERFPVNTDMSWLVRLTLAMYAEVYPGTSVTEISNTGNDQVMLTANDHRYYPRRVIDARGLGNHRTLPGTVTFPEFMGSFDHPFPLRGMDRVAVIGGGDAGRVVVEALSGTGITEHTSVPALDSVRVIDWYGTGIPMNKYQWRLKERARYLGISSLFRQGVLTIIPVHAQTAPIPNGVLVNGRTYDLAVNATGWHKPELFGSQYEPIGTDPVIAQKDKTLPVYQVGPAATLATVASPGEAAQPRAGAFFGIFRLAPRTAALAESLD